ncbi:LysM peptidoglycan-binding domain-containing protein [Hyphomicrobium sp.]|uniref:LysM peptidoglycan-binding domain-containing protein n=1 Tax=Hyphomicrobium sp. TaxID=82 RepID=UPI000F9D65FE|nr:LysM peptidoglycan-binding domain-containing protein [Hyphomicrobium sp.]RUP10781.1 MAG: LysM peptidoglycan-binding domain-containing protein [Hyphomicrobium sp.]
MKNGEATVSAKKTAISSARAGAVTALLGVLALLPLPLDAAIDHGDARSLGATFAVDSRFPRVVAKDNDDTLDAQDEPYRVLAQDLPKPSGGAASPETAKDLNTSLWPPRELGVSDRVQDWLARANREFQTTIIRRLSTPAGGADADAIARKIEQVKHDDAEAAARTAKEAMDAAQAKLAAEAEAKHNQELSDAAAKAAEDAKVREAEAARLEAQRKADEAKRLAEEQKRQDQLRLAAEQKAAEQRAAEEAAAKERELAAQRAAEAAAAKKAEDERKAEAERQALKVAEEAKAKAAEEARRKAAEEDAKRIAAEEAQKAAAKERELAAQRAAEAAAAKKAEDERKAEAERQALKAAEEARAKAAEEARRKAAEDDAKRIAAEEAAKAAADREAKAKEAAEKVRLAEEAAKRDADAKRASESAKQAMVEDADKAKTNVAAASSAAEPPPSKAQQSAVTSKKASSRGEKGVARKRPHTHAHSHRAVKRHVAVASNSLARGPVVKPWVRRARQGRCRGAGEKVLLPGRYTVARGDNLWRIALRHYGSGSYFRRIYQANRGIIRNPNLIYQCERLYLPRR